MKFDPEYILALMRIERSLWRFAHRCMNFAIFTMLMSAFWLITDRYSLLATCIVLSVTARLIAAKHYTYACRMRVTIMDAMEATHE